MNPTELFKGITIQSDEHENSFRRRVRLFLTNGYSVSIVYGTGMYSHTLNGARHENLPPEASNAEPEASLVEVAVIHPNGKFVPFTDGEEVRGWTGLDIVFKIVAWAAALPSATATV